MGEVWDFPKLKERNELEEFEQRIKEKDEKLKNSGIIIFSKFLLILMCIFLLDQNNCDGR